MTECRYDKTTSTRLLNGRHHRDCNTSGCPGCQPCTERHCQITRPNGKPCPHHVTVDGRGTDQTCATCLGETRTHLAGLVTMSASLLGEAITRGLNSEAFALTGPVADPEAWGYHRMSALAARIDPKWLDDQVDMHHPAWVLGTWTRETRDHLDQPTDTRPTVTEARAYLDHHLTLLAHDPGFAFDELATDVRLCHDHLERVLHLDEHTSKGPPCYICGHRAVTKDYGTDPTDPVMWHCPSCDNWWDPNAYADKTRSISLEVAEHLTITDLAARTRVPAGTLRRWAYGERRKKPDGSTTTKPPRIHPSGHTSGGARLYRVADIVALRDEQPDRVVS